MRHLVLILALMFTSLTASASESLFSFTRGTIDYDIKVISISGDSFLVAEYPKSSSASGVGYRHILDLYELESKNGAYYNQPDLFLDKFLEKLNEYLDRAHPSGPATTPRDILIQKVRALGFDGKHVFRT